MDNCKKRKNADLSLASGGESPQSPADTAADRAEEFLRSLRLKKDVPEDQSSGEGTTSSRKRSKQRADGPGGQAVTDLPQTPARPLPPVPTIGDISRTVAPYCTRSHMDPGGGFSYVANATHALVSKVYAPHGLWSGLGKEEQAGVIVKTARVLENLVSAVWSRQDRSKHRREKRPSSSTTAQGDSCPDPRPRNGGRDDREERSDSDSEEYDSSSSCSEQGSEDESESEHSGCDTGEEEEEGEGEEDEDDDEDGQDEGRGNEERAGGGGGYGEAKQDRTLGETVAPFSEGESSSGGEGDSDMEDASD